MDQKTIFVKMLVPQKPFLVKDARSISIPAKEGPYLVLPGRAPAIKLLNSGVVTLNEPEKGVVESYFISTGVVKIREDACTILADRILSLNEINLPSIKKELEGLEKREQKPEEEHLNALTAEKAAFLRQVIGYCEKRK